METFPLLSLTVFLPLIGAGLIFLVRTTAERARWAAFWTSLFTFLVSLWLWFLYEPGSAEFQFVERFVWLPRFGVAYHVGVDGISVLFILLSTFLTLLCVMASWRVIRDRVREYMMALLVLETMMTGAFAALDFVLFYIFFEGVLIPMFIIIGVWGGPRRVYAAFKFFLYTLAGSVLLLAAILVLAVQTGTTDIPALMQADLPRALQGWLWWALFASFAVKMPMWPVHTWLPDAHVEAPTAGSVILAGVLLKMGGYGFLRFSLPILPLASEQFAPVVYTLSVIAIVYTSLVALAQEDIKKLIAYSSVAHMGFVTIGIFSANSQGVEGALFQMLSHGIISGALFLCVGVLYDRVHTREIAAYGGVVARMPRYAFFFMIFMLGSVGLPGTSGFVGEVLVLFGAWQVSSLLAILAATGIVLGAAYMLFLYRRVIFGALKKESLRKLPDLEPRETAVLLPLAALVLWMGLYPTPVLNVFHASVDNLVGDYRAALLKAGADAGAAAPPAGP